MKKLLTTLLLFAAIANLFAEISVKSFRKLDNDMTARIDAPKKDQNGDWCAIIKVVTTQTGFSFDNGMMGIVKTVNKPSEIWVYVPYGTKRLTISHERLGILRDYSIPESVEKATCYELVLTTGKVVTTVEDEIESEYVVITPVPADAMVYLNDQFVKSGIYQAKIKPGTYTYRIEAPLYHTEAGTFEMLGIKKELNFTLKPAFGFLSFSTSPEQESKVLIDGKPQLKTTPFLSDPIASGEHTVQFVKEMYQPFAKKVVVQDNLTTPLEIALKPNFADVSITAPVEAKIYVNNQFKAAGTWEGRLTAGIYSLEAQMDKHRTAKQDVELSAGETKSYTLKPTPIYGTLDVITTPPGASVSINGKIHETTTPTTIKKLLIGNYDLRITKTGYASVSKVITITANKSTEVNETLSNGQMVSIFAQPDSIEITIDNTSLGISPYVGSLTLGTHILKISKDGETATKKIAVVESGDTLRFTIDFTPTYGKVDVVTSPNAQIYINGSYKAMGKWSGELQTGNYSVELRESKCKTVLRTIEVYEDERQRIEAKPEPICGTLQIDTEPSGAAILVDGRDLGQTPLLNTKLQIGSHLVRLSAANCLSIEKNIQIQENEKTELKEVMQGGKDVEITSMPSGAEFYIDNKLIGNTPKKTPLLFGSHKLSISDGTKEKADELKVSPKSDDSFHYDLYDCYSTKYISSSPSGASVYAESDYIGTTPFSYLLKNKEADLSIEKSGYKKYSTTLACTGGDVDVQLKPKIIYHFSDFVSLGMQLDAGGIGQIGSDMAYSQFGGGLSLNLRLTNWLFFKNEFSYYFTYSGKSYQGSSGSYSTTFTDNESPGILQTVNSVCLGPFTAGDGWFIEYGVANNTLQDTPFAPSMMNMNLDFESEVFGIGTGNFKNNITLRYMLGKKKNDGYLVDLNFRFGF